MADTNNSLVTYIPQIDYTSRDYIALLNDLTTLAQQFNPKWSATNPSDIGVTLLELFAYLGDILNYYADRSASEGFLSTASQRQSILQLAAMLGYAVTTNQPAIVNLTLGNTSASDIIVPSLTQFKGSQIINGQTTDVTFELDSDAYVPANSSVTVTATQGITYSNVTLGTSTGAPNQVFKINSTNVIINGSGSTASLKVFVGDIQYTYVSTLVDSTSYDSTFTTSVDSDGYTYVIFGDGVFGRVPTVSLTVTATYRVGVGADGNISAGTITGLANNNVSNITVTQTSDASGGTDIESSDSIRVNAPRALRTLRRAVSLKDYAYMALQVPGVSKAIADSSVWTSVNLYVGPNSSAASSTYGPFTGVTKVEKTASDSTAYVSGTSYLTYTCTNSGLAVGQYVSVTGMAPVNYNIYAPVLVTYADSTKFTVQGTYSTAINTGLSANAKVTSTGDPTTSFASLQSTILSYFTDKVAPNVNLSVQPPSYVPVNIDLDLKVIKSYQQSTVLAQVDSMLSSLFDYNNSFFADIISPNFIVTALLGISGVDTTTVITHLRRNTDEKVFSVSYYTNTTTAITLTTSTNHSLVAGDTIYVYNVDSTVDGTYTIASATSNTVTFNKSMAAATPTGITSSTSWTTATTELTVSSTTGIQVGMNVTGTNLISTVKSIGTGKITLNSKPSGSGTGALTFTKPYSSADNYIRLKSIETVNCAINEIPVKGTITIKTTGGLS
ncbi:MAG: hypothetical protein EBR82_19705 [Caulobacteraceae bacterium]|nr:hypothetical protein [Caulobacteraceae bacterium]